MSRIAISPEIPWTSKVMPPTYANIIPVPRGVADDAQDEEHEVPPREAADDALAPHPYRVEP